MVNISTYVVHAGQVAAYSPEGHKGTVNRRLIGKETVGARNMEVVLGQIETTGLAGEHYHEAAEQAVYLLEGKCRVEVEGITDELRPGDIVFFPPGTRHKIVPVGGSIKILVIYSPPLENATTAFKS